MRTDSSREARTPNQHRARQCCSRRWFNSVSSTACFRHLIPPLFAHTHAALMTQSLAAIRQKSSFGVCCEWVYEWMETSITSRATFVGIISNSTLSSSILPCAAVWSVECCAQAKTIRSEEGMEKTKICSQTVNVVIISSVQVFAAFRWTLAVGLRYVSRPYVFRASRVFRYSFNVRQFILFASTWVYCVFSVPRLEGNIVNVMSQLIVQIAKLCLFER